MRGGNGPAKDLGMITRSCTHYTHYMPAYFRLLSRYTATTTVTFSLKLLFNNNNSFISNNNSDYKIYKLLQYCTLLAAYLVMLQAGQVRRRRGGEVA